MSTETKRRSFRHLLVLAAALAFAVGSHGVHGQQPDGDAAPGETAQDTDPQTRIGTPPDELEGEEPEVPDLPRLDDPDDGELPAGGDRAFLSAVLSAGAARDEGFQVGAQELEDTAYVVTPTLLFLNRPSERAELAIGYAPEIERFEDHPELDAVHHAAGLLWRVDPTEQTRISIGASLLDGEDPSRHLDGLIVLLPRAPYTQGRAYIDLQRRWRFTGLQFQVGRTDTEIEAAEGLFGSGIDQTDDYAMLTLERTVGRRADIFASYSYIHPTPGSDAPTDEQGSLLPGVLTEPIQSLLLGFNRRMTRRVTLEIAGGLLDDGRDRVEGEDRYTWLASGEIQREGDELNVRVRYDRSLLSLTPTIPAAGGAGGPAPPSVALHESLSHTATVEFEVRPGPYLRWQQLVRATRAELDEIEGSALAAEDIETIALTSRLIVPATRRFALYGQVDHLEQQGGFFAPDEGAGERSRTRYGAGLIIGISGPPAAWGIRQEPALLLRTLRPDRY